jgi:hypothetical protein
MIEEHKKEVRTFKLMTDITQIRHIFCIFVLRKSRKIEAFSSGLFALSVHMGPFWI